MKKLFLLFLHLLSILLIGLFILIISAIGFTTGIIWKNLKEGFEYATSDEFDTSFQNYLEKDF